MFLYKKVVRGSILLVILIVVVLTTWYLWPGKVEIQTDLSENEDNEKNIGSINGPATNSQNNNQKHINFSGDFIFTLLIFILLLIQSIFQSFIFLSSTRMNIGGNKMTKDNKDNTSSDPIELQQMQGQQAPHFSHPPTQSQLCHSYPAPSSSSLPSPPPTPGNAYYTINENNRYPYAPMQNQISIDCQTEKKSIETKTEPDYKELYNHLKMRSSAAGLEV